MSVRVPKSKRKEYRVVIKNFVEKKFASESSSIDEFSKVKISKKESDGFRKFEEFLNEIKKSDEKEETG